MEKEFSSKIKEMSKWKWDDYFNEYILGIPPLEGDNLSSNSEGSFVDKFLRAVISAKVPSKSKITILLFHLLINYFLYLYYKLQQINDNVKIFFYLFITFFIDIYR